MQPRVIGTLQGQDLDLLKENKMVSIGDCMLGHCRLLQLPQATTVAVFTYAGVDAVLHGANVHLAAWARHAVYASRWDRIPCILHWPQELFYLLGQLLDGSHALQIQQSASAVRHTMNVGQERVNTKYGPQPNRPANNVSNYLSLVITDDRSKTRDNSSKIR